jgi:DNA polymerase I - 3''-5'' exonuclease and polymerase domains
MQVVAMDFESYYDKDYSLRKMTPVEYILDPRFECMGCGITINGLSTFMEEDQFRALLARPGFDQAAVVSHNALFDMCILAWRFGFVPKLMIDSMGLARAWLQHLTPRVSLAAITQLLGLGAKGDTVLKVVGMRKDTIKEVGLWREYTQYCMNDSEKAWGIFQTIMAQGFPVKELLVLDSVLRCAVQPKFELDQTLLYEHLHEVQTNKQRLIDQCGLEDRSMLLSNDKFADLLRQQGVQPPLKTSLTTGKETYAFAKTDAAMQDLEEHPNPNVQALVAARLGIKTTIEETRAQRFISISNLTWAGNPAHGQARLMPFPLRYSGAHTHRLSGDWKLNTQNLSRGGKLRKSLKAREGYAVIVGDSSQVEARLVAWFCCQLDLVEQFAQGVDVYSNMASDVFGYLVNKKDHPDERFVGKQLILGCGYGLGWVKYQAKLVSDSLLQTGKQIMRSDEDAQGDVNTYRRRYPMVPGMWRRLNAIIPMMTKPNCHVPIGPIIIEHERIRGPNGLFLYYKDLHYDDDAGEWTFTYAGKRKRIYGGKMLENIIQFLARICTMDAGVRMRQKYNLFFALQAHDELGYVERVEIAEWVKQVLLEEMCVRPSWGLDLPLAAEAGIGQTYGDAK